MRRLPRSSLIRIEPSGTSGRLFYARMADLIAATDGNPTTMAMETVGPLRTPMTIPQFS